EVASKVWQGALELGVEVDDLAGKSSKAKGVGSNTEEETKKSSLEDHLIHSLRGHKDVNWVVQEPDGLLGVSPVRKNYGKICWLSSKKVEMGSHY
ncbi:hypothetical protein A2U01_0039721, partial [Trifolium medium]|nr:hypothetical protein [Trifolium medium]